MSEERNYPKKWKISRKMSKKLQNEVKRNKLLFDDVKNKAGQFLKQIKELLLTNQ